MPLGDRLKQLFLQGQGVVTQEAGAYNPKIERFSKGINTGTDIGVPVGTPITLPKGNWRIEEAYSGDRGKGYIGNASNRGYGNSVVARNVDTGEAYRFSHLLKSLVGTGQTLSGGILGYSGNTGNTTGPHVDIETYGRGQMIPSATLKTNRPSNPQDLFNLAKTKYGKTLRGITNDPKKLQQFAGKKGVKIQKITL